MKPELTLLSVLTAVGSSAIAMRGDVRLAPLVVTFIGTLFVGGGAGTLNQVLEREFDGRMKRTERRPLPAGRIAAQDALSFGVLLSAAGVLVLTLFANLVAGILAVLILASYLFVYTPLKRVTPFATVVGGIPGGLPPIIGWAVVRGSVSFDAWPLFFLLFFWQMPHFLSLAWMYRRDYARGGYKVLPVVDPGGAVTSRQILIFSAAMIPASVLPALTGLAGFVYCIGAFLLSLFFLAIAVLLFRQRSVTSARRMFAASLVYLPTVFLLMMVG